VIGLINGTSGRSTNSELHGLRHFIIEAEKNLTDKVRGQMPIFPARAITKDIAKDVAKAAAKDTAQAEAKAASKGLSTTTIVAISSLPIVGNVLISMYAADTAGEAVQTLIENPAALAVVGGVVVLGIWLIK
jgi:hypothetical protein